MQEGLAQIEKYKSEFSTHEITSVFVHQKVKYARMAYFSDLITTNKHSGT